MKIGFVPLIGDEAPGVPRRYAGIRDMAQLAEGEGFDSVWLFDHLLHRSPGSGTEGIWECWTTLTALAEATRRVELGTIVMCTQFRNPALLAKMADTLDEVSNGRLILGMGAGWNEPEFRAFGYPFDHLASRFDEALQIIAPLLRTGRVDFSGTYYQAADCELAPRGPRPTGLPIMVAGSGPRMLRLTARYADMWNTAWLGSPEPFPARKAAIDQACITEGRDPATLAITVGVGIYFPDLGGQPSFPRQNLTGSVEQIAASLAEYDRLGVTHLQVMVAPYVPAAVSRFADAIRVYRSQRPAKQ